MFLPFRPYLYIYRKIIYGKFQTFEFWFSFRFERVKPDTLFSMSKYCICRNDINFPNSKLGFSLHATEPEYKKLDFHMLNTLCSSYSSIKEWMGMPERCLRTEEHCLECVSVRVLLAYPYRTFLLLLSRRTRSVASYENPIFCIRFFAEEGKTSDNEFRKIHFFQKQDN